MNPIIHIGDCIDGLRTLDDGCAQTCITSPPYFGLRDYGVDGQVGLESTVDEYVAALVSVFREVHRVLREDGTLWINIGDSYAASGRGGGGGSFQDGDVGTKVSAANSRRAPRSGFKQKDLMGVPWRVAFALQADGWYLRQEIIWAKPNPMPESVRDRCTRAHEYIFMLSKCPRYYYDQESIREASSWNPDQSKMPDGWDTGPGSHGSFHRNGREKGRRTDKQRGHSRRHAGFNDRWDGMSKAEQQAMGRNKRSVWTVATKPFKEAHFATFPPDLIRPCVIAGAPPDGLVIDPFAGSGTTGLVAMGEGREFWGCELNPEYAAMAKRRIQEGSRQARLIA